MAAQQIVIVALICFAIIGMVSASDPAAAAASDPKATAEVASSSPNEDNAIGTDDGDDDAAPVGAPVSESTFHNLTPAPSPHSGATALEFSVLVAAAAFFV